MPQTIVISSVLRHAIDNAQESDSAVIDYRERYVAFVDILGFRELIEQLTDSPEHLAAIRMLMRQIHEPISIEPAAEFKSQSISDAVVMSSSPTVSGLKAVCTAIEFLAVNLLGCGGYFVRGAIVRGLLCHDKQVAFGEALVRAYHLESKVARYPRIVFSNEVINDINNPEIEADFDTTLRQASDGLKFLHVLDALEQYAATFPDTEYVLTQYGNIRDMIQFRLDQAAQSPDHLEKVLWFSKYWNEVLPSFPVQL